MEQQEIAQRLRELDEAYNHFESEIATLRQKQRDIYAEIIRTADDAKITNVMKQLEHIQEYEAEY